MATVDANQTDRKHGAIIVTWANLTPDDDGNAYQPPAGYILESVHVTGADGGGTLTIQGTNNPDLTGFADITDSGSTADWLYPLANINAFAYKPDVSGGTGTDVTFRAFFRHSG